MMYVPKDQMSRQQKLIAKQKTELGRLTKRNDELLAKWKEILVEAKAAHKANRELREENKTLREEINILEHTVEELRWELDQFKGG
jgi:cell division protein FtsB